MLKRLATPLALLALVVIAVPADAKHKPTQRARIHALEKQNAHDRALIRDLYARLVAVQEVAEQALSMAAHTRSCLQASPAGTEDALSTSSNLFPVDGIPLWQPVRMSVITHRGSDFLAYIDPVCTTNGQVPVAVKR